MKFEGKATFTCVVEADSEEEAKEQFLEALTDEVLNTGASHLIRNFDRVEDDYDPYS